MKLFNAIEKCFPAMEKQYRAMMPENPDDYWPPVIRERENWERLRLWVAAELLPASPELMELFDEATISNPRHIAELMVEWFLLDLASKGEPIYNDPLGRRRLVLR